MYKNSVLHLSIPWISLVELLLRCLIITSRWDSVSFGIIFVIFFGFDYFFWSIWFLDHPVEDIVIFVAASVKQVFEEFPQISDIRLFFEFQRSAISQVKTDFFRKVLAKLFNLSGEFLISNFFIFFFFCSCRDALPRKLTFYEVKENVTKRLKIVSSSLLNT